MGDDIYYEDFGGEGPILHFAHPNAYPPACFSPILEPLTAGNHVIAMHHRPLWPGHEPEEFDDWQLISDDLQRFLNQQGYEGVIGVGHSLGAVATMKVAWQQPRLFRALILIDPVFLPPRILQQISENPHLAKEQPMVQMTRKRRTHWPDRQSAFDHFRAKPIFERWPDESLWAYINSGMIETAEGEVTLAYSKEWEAQIYAHYPQGIWEEIPRLSQPTLAIRGAESMTLTEEAWQLWQALQPQATFVEIADAGHMVPMERPRAVVDVIDTFLACVYGRL